MPLVTIFKSLSMNSPLTDHWAVLGLDHCGSCHDIQLPYHEPVLFMKSFISNPQNIGVLHMWMHPVTMQAMRTNIRITELCRY